MPDINWPLILNRIRKGHCTPFLGAGASISHSGEGGLLSAGELAAKLAKECEYPGTDDRDLLRVTQYYVMKFDGHIVRERIADLLPTNTIKPSEIHTILASLPFTHVLTTNFDNLMERSFAEAGKTSRAISYFSADRPEEINCNATVDSPLVYKLHGSLEDPLSMVVTEDDVIDFLANLIEKQPPIPREIKNIFEQHTILFIGYGLKDWNIRAMIRGIRGRRTAGRDYIKSFAIQRRPDDPRLAIEWAQTVGYMDRREGVQCYDIDASEFVKELKKRFDKGEGQQ